MRKSLSILILSLVISTPLWGGTVYIPLAGERFTPEGHELRTEVRIYNDSGEGQRFTYLFIPVRTDGSLMNREELPEIMVPPRVTLRFDDLAPANQRGFLEINADDNLAITARLVSDHLEGQPTLGTEVPVITSRNTISPGRTAVIQGLSTFDGETTSDFFLLNFGLERGDCTIDVRKRGGTRVVNQTISVPPLSLFPFDSVLELLNLTDTGDVTIAVTCSELSFPFGVSRLFETAEVLFIPPSAKGSSGINVLPSADCPADALLRLDGTFHVPTSRNERGTFFVATAPNEVFSRITLDMEFTISDWNRGRPSGLHSIFWLNRTSVWSSNLFGYLNAFGPRKNEVKLATNVSLARGVVNSVQKGAVLEPGETYTVKYIYDTRERFIEAVISRKGGEEIARLNDVPSVREIRTDNNFMLVFGHSAEEAGAEVTTDGWEYANLCFQLE